MKYFDIQTILSVFDHFVGLGLKGLHSCHWAFQSPMESGNNRSSLRSCFIKKIVLKNFAIFTGNHLWWSLFLTKLQAIRPTTLLERDSNTGVYLGILRNCWEQLFLRTSANGCFYNKKINFSLFPNETWYQFNMYRIIL